MNDPGLWTASQRGVLLVLLSLMLAYQGYLLLNRPMHVPNPPPPEGARAGELEDRIDPNRADWPTLAALPVIGERRARDIVAYREQFIANNPTRLAFLQPDDLKNISGIGDAIVAQIEPFLRFPASPTTRPQD